MLHRKHVYDNIISINMFSVADKLLAFYAKNVGIKEAYFIVCFTLLVTFFKQR